MVLLEWVTVQRQAIARADRQLPAHKSGRAILWRAEQRMLGSTAARDHLQAASGKGAYANAVGRSRGGLLTSKIDRSRR